MSVSSIGSSDAYARYRQQLNLLSSSSQGTPVPQTTSRAVPLDGTGETASSSYATKFKTDLSSLNNSRHHGHAHAPTDATANASDASGSQDSTSTNDGSATFKQTMDELASILNVAAKIASVVI